MNFFRAFVKPSSFFDVGTLRYYRFANSQIDTYPCSFVEIVSVGSGPNDQGLQFVKKPTVFVKRVRLNNPNAKANYAFKTLAQNPIDVFDLLNTPFLDIGILAKDPNSGSNDFPLRIRSFSDKDFQGNEWIDTNEFLKQDQSANFLYTNRVVLDSTFIVIDYGTNLATLNDNSIRFEIEFYSNLETKH